MSTQNPLALATDIRRVAHELLDVAEALTSNCREATNINTDKAKFLKPNGRMTETGIEAIYAEFNRGMLSNKEMAENFNISLSGVMKRKAQWRRGEI